MKIKNRLFPYPVLCGDTDDYLENAEFQLEPNLKETTHELILSYDYYVNCNALNDLVRKGQAEFVLHIECSSTAYRLALKSNVPHIDMRIQKSQVNGEINIVAMIVTKMAVKNYRCDDLNVDYSSEIVNFDKGSILAYINLPPVFITKKTEELANNESFFSVIKQTSLDPEEIKPLSFNLANDKIQIYVDQKTYEAYIRYQHSGGIAMSMLVLPALVFMLEELDNNPDSYANYQWFQRMAKYYKSIGKDFISDVVNSEESLINIAQEMLNSPISKAYRELYLLEE